MLGVLLEGCVSTFDAGDEPSTLAGDILFYLPLTENKIYRVILPNNKQPDLIYAPIERQTNERIQINSLSCGPNNTLLFHMRHIIEESSSTPRRETTNIVTYALKTKEIINLAAGNSSMRFPVLSLDESKLAMSGGDSFFIKDLKTGHVLHYTQMTTDLVVPWSWSPDGNLLALTIQHIGSSPVIYFFDMNKKVLLPWLTGMQPYFSPTGQFIAYLSLDNREIIIADKDGKTRQSFKGHLFRHLNGWLGEDKVLFTRGVAAYSTRIGTADLKTGKLYDLKMPDANEISGICFRQAS
jgi:WD40 repeat protein